MALVPTTSRSNLQQDIIQIFNKSFQNYDKERNIKILDCVTYSNLDQCLSNLNSTQPFSNIHSMISVDEDNNWTVKNLSVLKKTVRTIKYYTFGVRATGGVVKFSVWDRCNIKLCKSEHGLFLSILGDRMPLYKNLFEKLMGMYMKTERVMIDRVKVIPVFPKDEMDKRQQLLDKMFIARQCDNEVNVSLNSLTQSLVLTPMTSEKFDEIFKIIPGKKTGEMVRMVVGSIIHGVNENLSVDKEIFSFDDNSTAKDTDFMLNVVPFIYIYFE
ncbi:dbp [Spodoptera litura granulovirus]|uniref:Dbp n=1 Tax=Spodoptera litura granulovirus TaxID=359919 RepID=A5IZS2_9BBAC|nr:dbp [Spodoptera litura granulovirus]ABQ52013.1 dbp [Spodoptera litura granulovirus]